MYLMLHCSNNFVFQQNTCISINSMYVHVSNFEVHFRKTRMCILIFTTLRANSAVDKLMMFFLFFSPRKRVNISCRLSLIEI